MKYCITLALFLVSCGTTSRQAAPTPAATQVPAQTPVPQTPPTATPRPEPLPPVETPSPTGGAEIYAAKCSPCHGRNPDIGGASASEIKSALAYVRDMRNVSVNNGEITEIAAFLADQGPGGGGGGGGGGDDDDDEGGEDDD